MKISVLITTYRRLGYLKNCISSILVQSRPANEIIVVYHSDDFLTKSFLEEIANGQANLQNLILLPVNKQRIIAANNVGMKRVTGDIIVFIDDDAIAEKHWLLKIEKYYLNYSDVGAVGGRDIIHEQDGRIVEGFCKNIGRLTWYGKFTNGHHLQTNGVKDVDTLKGCNMSFRFHLIEPSCDTNIIGDCYNYEADLCFQVKKKGYKIIFDSTIIVHHFLAPSFLPGSRDMLSAERLYYSHHNQGYVLLKNLTFLKKIIFFVYFFLFDPLKWLVKLMISHRPLKLLGPIIRGKKDAIKTYLKYKKNYKVRALSDGEN